VAALWWLKKASDAERVLIGITANYQNFAIIVTTYSFTMLGFLAAVMALFSLLGQSQAFKAYKERGLLFYLLLGISVAMIELACCFWSGMRLFIGVGDAKLIQSIVLAVGSFFMVSICVAPIIVLQIVTSKEPDVL
jgi:hypothetical protein